MSPTQDNFKIKIVVPENQLKIRVDKFVSDYLNKEKKNCFSRSQIQYWIKEKWLLVGKKPTSNKNKISPNQIIEINAKIIEGNNQHNWKAYPIKEKFEIIFEDEQLLIINKPAGLVVHPGLAHQRDTLINELLSRYSQLEKIPRNGIVHRIDKDTSGLLCVAKTNLSQQKLSYQISHRLMKKQYLALVNGRVISGGRIDEPITRAKSNRLKQVVHANGRESITEYVVQERFKVHSLLNLTLITGRTHQIRVHLQHIGFPIVGDPIYHLRQGNFIAKGSSSKLITALQSFKRQALHARYLKLIHPLSEKEISFKADFPDDLKNLIKLLREE